MSASRPTCAGPDTFETICSQCATLAVTFHHAEGALDSTPVFCSNCGRLRGLIGSIRKMAHEGPALLTPTVLSRL